MTIIPLMKLEEYLPLVLVEFLDIVGKETPVVEIVSSFLAGTSPIFINIQFFQLSKRKKTVLAKF